MARLARVVVPGLPHHVTQRGNGRHTAEHGALHLCDGIRRLLTLRASRVGRGDGAGE